MRCLFLSIVAGALGLCAALATDPLYQNNAPLQACTPDCSISLPGYTNTFCPDIPPVIDATTFVNRSLFDVTICSYPPWPYETLSTLYFTNTGTLFGSPGYRFDNFVGNNRSMMNAWVNQGSATADTWLMTWAHNISSSGPMTVGPAGLLRLEGGDINIRRNALRSGLVPGTYYSDTYSYGSNYYNAAGVSDLYWGGGTNNYFSGGQPMSLANSNWTVPCAYSPMHQVMDTRYGGIYTNLVTVPQYVYYSLGGYCFKQFNAYVWENQINATSRVVQVVFVSTNAADTNFTSNVRFYPQVNGTATAIVELGSTEYDMVTQSYTTNYVYFADYTGSATNVFMARNYYGGTRKPSTYEVFRNMPFEYFLGLPPNAPYSPGLIYNPTYQSNSVPVLYSAYAANITSAATTNIFTGYTFTHPTNYPGRVEVIGDDVNLDQARIRAESTVIIKAKNLVNNRLARVDAPYCVYDLGSTQSPLYITNLAPPTVSRFAGQLYAWSAAWSNLEGTTNGVTNLVRFHVLMLDSDIQSTRPVSITSFAAHTPGELVINDTLNIAQTMLLDCRSLYVSGAINLPPGSGWNATNAPTVLNFTNDGFINSPKASYYGADRATRYQNIVNRGTNTAAAQFVETVNFYNSGAFIANSGLLSIDATGTASLIGAGPSVVTNLVPLYYFLSNSPLNSSIIYTSLYPTVVTNYGATLLGNSDVQINTRDLVVSNSFIAAGGALLLDVNNRLTDGAPGGTNRWSCNNGFQFNHMPAANNNLLSTWLTSSAVAGREVFHTWPAVDRGAVEAGFSANLALGKLTLDGGNNSWFHFNASGGSAQRALYVDYLELLNFTTNVTEALDIADNFTIYFANANMPVEKLDRLSGGRLRWVSTFAGPLSGTNVVYPTPPYPAGTVVRANFLLVTSTDRDSDADGLVNAYDPTPFYLPESVGLTILPSKGGTAVISWNALAKSANTLEYQPALSSTWFTLTNFTQGVTTSRASVRDSLSGSEQKIYRVRVDPGPEL